MTSKRHIYIMQKTILFANQKGGVGKTTLSINLASGLKKLGFNPLVIDMDNQKSSSLILSQSQELKIDCLDHFTGLEKLQYDFIIFDIAPRLNDRLIDVIKLVDYVVIPIKPSLVDYLSSLDMIDNIEKIINDKRRKNKLRYGVVLNNSGNNKNIEELKADLNTKNITLLGELKKRNAYEIEVNKTVYESKNKQAINEFNVFIDTLLNQIK